jgi:hypothetical protein
MKKLIIGIILTVFMTPVVMAQQTMTATGEVVSVRLVPRTFSVRDAQAREVIRYNVPLGTPVTIAGGQARLGHLRAGDTVNVTYRATDEGRQATQIQVPQPSPGMDQRVSEGLFSTITGRIDAINYGTRVITVIGDQSGERYSYAVPRDTTISVTGQSAVLGNLRRGDQVILRFAQEDQERVAARVRVPQTPTPLSQRPVQAPSPVAAQAQPSQLPRTASALPLLGLLGLFSLLGAGSLRIMRKLRKSQ